jgi:histone H3/H4
MKPPKPPVVKTQEKALPEREQPLKTNVVAFQPSESLEENKVAQRIGLKKHFSRSHLTLLAKRNIPSGCRVSADALNELEMVIDEVVGDVIAQGMSFSKRKTLFPEDVRLGLDKHYKAWVVKNLEQYLGDISSMAGRLENLKNIFGDEVKK